jgi:phosphoglycerate dehydrogenase-like enzyme
VVRRHCRGSPGVPAKRPPVTSAGRRRDRAKLGRVTADPDPDPARRVDGPGRDNAHDVILCTDTFLDEHRHRLESLAPHADVVVLTATGEVGDADRARITIAFFSTDAWPDRASSFMVAALGAPRLRWFHTMSAGVDHPVFRTFLDRGVVLTTSSGSSALPIADTAIMYLLALSCDLPRMMRAKERHEWAWARWSELAGRRIAVVGWGPIGREIARLAVAHGMAPTVVRRRARGDEGFPTRRLDELAAVVADHDAVAVALPLTAETTRVVSAPVIAAMRPGALFVNVGRGELVDQAALTAALRDGHLGGAGLDVTDPEPLPPDDPLWELPNVIITPHNSGSTDGTARRAVEAFLDNLRRWCDGAEMLNRVEP